MNIDSLSSFSPLDDDEGMGHLSDRRHARQSTSPSDVDEHFQNSSLPIDTEEKNQDN